MPQFNGIPFSMFTPRGKTSPYVVPAISFTLSNFYFSKIRTRPPVLVPP